MQDLTWLIKKFLKINCENIFCTKIASKLVRTILIDTV